MKLLLVLSLGLILKASLASAAEPSQTVILSCAGEGDGWTSEVTISDHGHAQMSARKEKQPPVTCELKIRKFNYSPEALTPEVLFEFDRSPCVPKLAPKVQKELLDLMVLRVELQKREKGKPFPALLHWLRYSQSSDCMVRTYDASAVKLAHDRWKKELWPN